MNKQQEKEYKKYVEEFVQCPDAQEQLTKEEFVEALEKQEAEEQQAYLDYQGKIGENNAKLPEGKEPEIIKTKEQWIKAGKPTGETKAERFIRLVEPRTNKVLDVIEKLENLISPNYESTLKQREQVLAAIGERLAELEACYVGEKVEKKGFQLTL